ncbi:hypothetical protein [Streptomyces sp. NPDC096142]|uniref:DUF7426 family protein n=1 Tax=Streptomyces sp. NPDC096142 TaxID=3366077 RepID=UPI0038064D2A
MAANESFEALDQFLDEYLELPVKGADGETRVYRIEEPSAEDGIRIEKITMLGARLAAGGAPPEQPVLGDDEERNLWRMCLGAAYDQLLADGVSWSRFKHTAMTAMFWVVTDKETAREFWRTGQRPGKAENRAARRAQAKPGTSASGEANSTRSQGSTSGTRGSRPRRRRGSRT